MKELNETRRSRAGKTEEGKKRKKQETIWRLYPDVDVPPDSYRRATGQCRLVLSINRHLDLLALPAGLRLPQAVLTKQTYPFWLEPNPHTYTLISCVHVRIAGLTKVTSGVASDWVDRFLLKWAALRLSPISETSQPQKSRPHSVRWTSDAFGTQNWKQFREGKSLNLTGWLLQVFHRSHSVRRSLTVRQETKPRLKVQILQQCTLNSKVHSIET